MGCMSIKKNTVDTSREYDFIAGMTKDQQIAIRVTDKLLSTLDDIRRGEPDLPTRAEMIRRLIERGAPQSGVQRTARK